MFTAEIAERNLQQTKQGIERVLYQIFPIKGSKHTIEISKVELGKTPAIYDYNLQKELKLKERSLTAPLRATFTLRNNETNAVIDEQRLVIMRVPVLTPRGSYLIDGSEYQTANQLRLRSGAYTTEKQNGQFETQVNTLTGWGFRLLLDAKSGIYTIRAGGKATVYLYPFLKGIGITDAEIARYIGRELLEINRQKHGGKDIREMTKFMKAFGDRGAKVDGKSPDEIRAMVHDYFGKTLMDGDVTKITLGKSFNTVTPELILMAAQKLLRVMRGEVPQDDRDSLEFKKFMDVTDHLVERIDKRREGIKRSISRRLDRFRDVRAIVNPNEFNTPIKSFFTKSSLAATTEQTNPLAMLGEYTKVTIMGEGGVEKQDMVTLDMINVNPSTLGFLDPVHTPESDKVGVTLHLTQTAGKKGDSLATYVIDAKTKEVKQITPMEMVTSVVAFPDQYDRKTNRFKASFVKVMNKKKLDMVPSRQVDYILLSPRSMFDTTTNLIPFLPNDQGNRASMAGKMQEQAVPLKYREAPLVQSLAGESKTFEEILGSSNALISPYDGEITEIGETIKIRTKDGIKEISYYNHFPLAEGSFIHHELRPEVKVGATVKKGQVLADSNFTKGSQLALGTNLRVAFMPYKGLTFEDGIVISESAAKKLTSEHLYVETIELDEDTEVNRRKWASHSPFEASKPEVLQKLDEDGVVKRGVTLNPGDVIFAAIKRVQPTPGQLLKQQISRSLMQGWTSASVTWNRDSPGTVVDVVKQSNRIKVTIKTEEQAREGDKLVGRHGNKGTISRIIPDNEMPHTPDGKPIELIINPHALPSRMNIGQVLETAAGAIAEKKGKPFLVDNFSGENYLQRIREDMKRLGIEDKQIVIDPNEGQLENKVFVGTQYILKLKHLTENKFSARSIGGYDRLEQPLRGGNESGQALDALTNYTLLAHGAKENLREMSVVKGQRNDEYWRNFQVGGALPELKPAFVFDKFVASIKALGINVEEDKRQGTLQLMAMTDKDVEKLSAGKIKDATLVMARTLKEEEGGLFDPQITGGREGGQNWSHIELSEPTPNPVFETPIRILLDLTKQEFDDVIAGRKKLHGKTGGEAIRFALSRIDVDQTIRSLREGIKEGRIKSVTAINEAHRKIRYLMALKKTGRKPEDYVLTKVPVLPPVFRPLYELPDGNLGVSDVNELYQHVFLVNQALEKDKKSIIVDEKDLGKTRMTLYDSLKALQGLSDPITADAQRRGRAGIIRQLGGSHKLGVQPKDAFFQRRVFRRRQDLSGRAIISVGPDLDVDEIGIPRDMAWKIFEMHIIRELTTRGGMDVGQARREVRDRTPAAKAALERVAGRTPVILNRAPSLHKFSTLAFKPKLVDSKTIHLPSLVTGSFNADFDGDSMSVHVPVSEKAQREALEKMLPSKNLFRPGQGDFMLMPGHEQVLGVYLLTKPPAPGRPVQGRFQTEADALKAFEAARRKKQDWKTDDPIVVRGKTITIGKIQFNSVLPTKYRDYDKQFDKGALRELFHKMHEDKTPAAVIVDVVNKLKDLGNNYAYRRGFTVSLDDIAVNTKTRDKIFEEAEKKLSRTTPTVENIEKIFSEATKKIEESIIKENPDNAFVHMDRSGARGGIQNLRQILGAPVLLVDNRGEIITTPVKQSYSEGLDTAGYWTSLYGARKGMIDRARETRDPGAFTKLLINSTIDHLITVKDCGTRRSLTRSINDSRAIANRNLAEDVKDANGRIIARRNENLTHVVLRQLKNAGVETIKVRSPLVCEAKDGVCAKCFGVMPDGREPAIGDNVGVIASHAMTEPTTQMTMNTFHTGGVKASADAPTSGLDRLRQLLEMPKNIPREAVLSLVDGQVKKIDASPTGGKNITVGDTTHFVPGQRQVVVKVGDWVKRGDRLSDGFIKPQSLLELKGMDEVRKYMTEELAKTYSNRINHNALETVVQKVTNLTRIIDPGLSREFVEGEYAPLNKVEELNRRGAKIIHEPELKGINTLPLYSSKDWVAKFNFRNIERGLLDSAALGAESKYKGTTNPIPAFAYGTEFGKTPGKY